MPRVLIAGAIAMILSIAVGPRFIAYLRRRDVGQQIRAEGPSGHAVKQGTPTMGGLLILVAAALSFLAVSRYTTTGLTVLFATVACGAIGFTDDYIKLTHRRSLGLRGRWKLLLLAGVTAVVALLGRSEGLDTVLYLPGLDLDLPLSWFWYPFLFLIIAGAANGVNLTDGIDGLAAGTGLIALFTFTAINVFAYIRTGQLAELADLRSEKLDLAILGAALIGGGIGFLWYNAFPAEVFMGDTGSMAIGGALAAFAIVTETELLLLLIGGIFVIEALSVMIQVATFKYLGRRVFLITPIHHHFEMKAWSETKIMVRFWIVTGVLCAVAFAIYYQYYSGNIESE